MPERPKLFLNLGSKQDDMIIRLIDIGDSKGVSIPSKLIKKYGLENEIEMKPVNGGFIDI